MKTQSLILICALALIACQPLIGGLHDYIFRQSRETLTRWAFTAEAYHRKVNNQQFFEGGLHDYIHTLNNREIANYILKEADEHPEIANKESLERLAVELEVVQPTVAYGGNGLHDYIWRMPRETLIVWALTGETYHREVNHQHLLGGLDDYIETLSNQQIIDYIMTEAKEHPELNSAEKFNSLANKYGIQPNSTHSHNVGRGRIGGDGGLHDFIWRTDRQTLESWAFASEAHHRAVNNQTRLRGGLVDYIWRINDTEVAQYILKEAKEHPEIASRDALNRLASKYGFAKNTTIGGLHDFIFRTDRNTLESWAFAAEAHHRAVNNQTGLRGGLVDYIFRINDTVVAEYIIKEANEHPEIASKEALNRLAIRYGFARNSTQNLTSGIIGEDGGLHDYIFRVPRSVLDRWALASEAFHREKNNLILDGGLHDYIGRLTNQEVIDYILREVNEHPELAGGDKLDAMVSKYGISNDQH